MKSIFLTIVVLILTIGFESQATLTFPGDAMDLLSTTEFVVALDLCHEQFANEIIRKEYDLDNKILKALQLKVPHSTITDFKHEYTDSLFSLNMNFMAYSMKFDGVDFWIKVPLAIGIHAMPTTRYGSSKYDELGNLIAKDVYKCEYEIKNADDLLVFNADKNASPNPIVNLGKILQDSHGYFELAPARR